MKSELKLDDELLCAYLDGELDAQTRTHVEQALVEDAGARVRLERMRAADDRLKTGIPLAEQRAHDPLADYVLNGQPQARVAWPRALRWPGLGAVAAGLSGAVLGWVLSSAVSGNDTAALAAPSKQLDSALQRAASGAVTPGDERTEQILLTFVAADGRYCRVFRSSVAGGEGLACRQGGRWRVLAWDGTVGTDADFRSAGASELLDVVMDRLGGSAALEPAEERRLIERNWERR